MGSKQRNGVRGTFTVIDYTTISRNGSLRILSPLHDANNAALRGMPLSLSPFLSPAQQGAAIFTDTELVSSADCDLRGWRTAPEIVTSSGSSLDGPALRRRTAFGQAVPFDYLDKVVDKVDSLRSRRIDL